MYDKEPAESGDRRSADTVMAALPGHTILYPGGDPSGVPDACGGRFGYCAEAGLHFKDEAMATG